jgi:hypothetical protein
MRWKPGPKLGALCVAVIAAACLGEAQLGHGGIYVTSLPPGAAVWLDGAYMGNTPVLVDGLPAGSHSVLLIRAGWRPQSQTVGVEPGQVVLWSARLTPATARPAGEDGRLLVRNAVGARVFVDGIELHDGGQPRGLSPGVHIITVERNNRKTTTTVQIFPQTLTAFDASELAAAPIAQPVGNELAPLDAYVPSGDFVVNGSDIIVHYKGVELQCAVGSLTYVLNGKAGSLSVAPVMVGNRPFLPVVLLERLPK